MRFIDTEQGTFRHFGLSINIIYGHNNIIFSLPPSPSSSSAASAPSPCALNVNQFSPSVSDFITSICLLLYCDACGWTVTVSSDGWLVPFITLEYTIRHISTRWEFIGQMDNNYKLFAGWSTGCWNTVEPILNGLPYNKESSDFKQLQKNYRVVF